MVGIRERVKPAVADLLLQVPSRLSWRAQHAWRPLREVPESLIERVDVQDRRRVVVGDRTLHPVVRQELDLERERPETVRSRAPSSARGRTRSGNAGGAPSTFSCMSTRSRRPSRRTRAGCRRRRDAIGEQPGVAPPSAAPSSSSSAGRRWRSPRGRRRRAVPRAGGRALRSAPRSGRSRPSSRVTSTTVRRAAPPSRAMRQPKKQA